MDSGSCYIPVIDFKDYKHGIADSDVNCDVLNDLGDQLKKAFKASGFCYIKNHGIDIELINKYFSISRNFFDQPVAEKKPFARLEADRNFGWVAVERERINPERPGDLKEAFNFYPPDDPHIWPSKIEDFQQTSKLMFQKCTELGHRICRVLSIGLGLEENFLKDTHRLIGHKGNQTTLRSLYYPPILDDWNIKPGQIRLGEHSDYGSITILFQDNIGGLQVEIPGIGFVPATPIPETAVVNIGDLMQRWTADQLIATKHRVLIPETEMVKKTCRQSVAFFIHPDDDVMIESLDGSNKYEPMTSLDYLKYRFSLTY